jgi:hypothetical protein
MLSFYDNIRTRNCSMGTTFGWKVFVAQLSEDAGNSV